MAGTTLEEDNLLNELVADIRNNRLILPTLPEVAVRIRRAVEDEQATSAQLEKLLGADAALSARLLQVANSPLMRGRSPVTDLKMAVTRLGNTLVRNLVISLVMEQLYEAKSARLKQRMKALWLHSTRVAAISHVFARRFTKLKPDEAMLAGLIHDIGILPIIKHAEKHRALLETGDRLDRIIRDHHGPIGKAILENWRFPPELVEAVAEHDNLRWNARPEADYTDVVLIANLHSYIGTRHAYTKLDWTRVPAFNKLALTPDESIAVLEEAREEVLEVQRLFRG